MAVSYADQSTESTQGASIRWKDFTTQQEEVWDISKPLVSSEQSLNSSEL